jgi:bifunctional non-homologous end joining protein LigD
VLNDEGLPDFQGLQNAFDEGASQQILYYLFDAPFLNGDDLRKTPLEDRRAALKKALKGAGKRSPLRFSDTFEAAHEDLVSSARALGLEGVIGKRVGSTYVSRRSDDWIKLKCRQRQEMVIVGYSAPKGSRSGFGALLVAVHEDGKLRYAGRVGTGFDAKRLDHLMAQMKPLKQDKSPLDKPLTTAQARGVQWLKPKLVAEVEFAEWTREGVVRQAAFIAQRTDKPAEQITHEKAVKPGAKNGRETVDKVSVSHPERIIDPESGTQKIDLAQFYHDIGDWVLPHVQGRPVSLLRAPDGVAGEQFFQKHAQHLAIPNITHLDQAIDPGHAPLMQIDSLPALIGAVQMGCIELHTWGATSANPDKPDRLILDLDPDPALPWRSMLEATRLTLAVLDELGLEAWLKTSGGKGMHIVVPLSKHADWDTVKGFAKALATFMTQQIPERFIDKMGPQNRIGKIFIDYLRNQRGASTASAYSVRARPGLAVSVPIERDELDGLKSAAQWNVGNLRDRLDTLKRDPWHDYHNRQRITRAQWKKLGAEPT